jgi:hypothetical protein
VRPSAAATAAPAEKDQKAAAGPKSIAIQRNSDIQREQETAVAVKTRIEPSMRAPASQDPHRQTRSTPPSSGSITQRVIVSSKHGRAGFSPAVVGAVAAICAIVGTIIFFLFVKR